MIRFALRRISTFPLILLLANFIGFTFAFYFEPVVASSKDESLVYIKDVALDSATGQIQVIQILLPNQVLFTEPAFFTGMDGGDYYRSGHEVMHWRRDGSDLQVEPARGWEAARLSCSTRSSRALRPAGWHGCFTVPNSATGAWSGSIRRAG